MESSRSFVAPIVFGVIVAVIAVWITVAVAISRDPEETVEEYLSAVAEKDVEGALELVSRSGYGVPYGDSAAFLTAAAISDDWRVVSVTEVGRQNHTTARVKAVIAGPGGTAEGEFEVGQYNDEWTLEDPFVTVRFPVSPLSYVRVNDKIVPIPRDASGYESYELFPGIYRFYGSVPEVMESPRTNAVAAFPSEDTDALVIVPSTLVPGRKALDRLQEVVKERIDECATFATPAPYGGCPFATDGEIDTPDGRRVSDLRGLTWKVATYPKVELSDDRAENSPGFALKATEPGSVTLTGSGEDTEGNPATFTVKCDMDLTGMRATVDARGEVTLIGSPTLAVPAGGNFNTCRRNT